MSATDGSTGPPWPVPAWLAGLANRIGIAPEGAPMVLVALVLALVVWLIGLDWLTIVLLMATLGIALFLRDPERTPARTEGVVISGADGRVCDVSEGSPASLAPERFCRVSVFMSPLNVHVNRAPVTGEVREITHTRGEFRAAFSDYASEHNERNLVVLSDDAGRRYAIVQVAGYLARRIICRLAPRDRIMVGGRIGLIMFGSRVDHFFPLDYRPTVALGERVRAGETVIGELTR